MQILKKLGKEDVAMKISRSVGPDWTNWTRDAGAIVSARQQLGDMIDQAMSGRSAAPSGNGATPVPNAQ